MKHKLSLPIILGFIISFMIIYFPKTFFKDFTPLALLGLWIIVVFILFSIINKKIKIINLFI